MEVGDIARRLGERAPDLARQIFPAGRLEGIHWRVGSIEGEPGGSMAVTISGSKQGIYKDFGADNGGDMLDLVRVTQCDGDIRAAVTWAKDYLGITDGPVTAGAVKRDGAKEAARRQAQEAEAATDVKRRRAMAQSIFLGARESLRNTPAADYLAGRGISLEKLGRQPRCLRFEPNLHNTEMSAVWPALVAAITGPDGAFWGVHRTWLEDLGKRQVVKAPMKQPRMALGSVQGGSIRLWRGIDAASKRQAPLSKAEPGSSVLICEGIEDGLSAALGVPEMRISVAVTLGNMAAIELPPEITKVYLCKENDTAPAAIAAFKRAVAAHQAAGRSVVIVGASAGKDLNDTLLGKVG